MKTPHKDAELLSAIANGEQMQRKNGGEWVDCSAEAALHRLALGMTTRIKPEHKPDVVRYLAAKHTYGYSPDQYKSMYTADGQFIKATFCGEYGKLKSVEVV